MGRWVLISFVLSFREEVAEARKEGREGKKRRREWDPGS